MHQGALFTTDWLTEGITATPQWLALDDARITQLWAQSRHLLDELLKRKNPTEADTEQKLIYPLLGLLGWDHISVQQNLTVRGRKDVPDALLFPDADADATASGLEPWQRFRHGSALVEAKRWGRPLDRQGTGDQGVPSTQIMHYLQRASVVTEGRMPWGILTNGRNWRLYYQNALSVAEDFFEIDLGKLFGLPGCTPELFDVGMSPEHAFRLFVLAFGREAFLPTDQGRSFHLIALDETKRWEERVRKDLAETVFSNVFPKLIAAIPLADPNRPAEINATYAEEVRSSALFLLYRLLFILYAEDRNLLPDETGPYSPYCLTRLRQEIEQLDNEGRKPLERSHAYWSRLETIFGAIAEGDDSLGIPPYNGGLFDAAESPLLSRIRLPDTVLAEVILALSHRREDGRLRYINYRDLSVQQLGSIYESILEYGVEPDLEARSVKPRADNQARHRSGPYYTPEPLVSLIIDDYLDVEDAVQKLQPELVLGTQMERHIAKRLGIPCAVISAPVHVQDFPARYSPQMGFEGANVLFDTWVHPLMMGLEEHLLAMFRNDFEFHDAAAPSHLGKSSAPKAGPAQTDVSQPNAPQPETGASERGQPAPAIAQWTADAEKELGKIPFFVRGKARRNTERYASEHGLTSISIETLYDAKAHFSR